MGNGRRPLPQVHVFHPFGTRTRSALSGTLQHAVVNIGEPEFEIAADAYAHFGRGRHPAALNMGDCYAYACAKVNRANLLFKGTDFSKTDIKAA